MRYSTILGTGAYLPEKILTNKDLEKTLDTSDEWIFDRTGIKERRVIGDNETTSSMGYEAALKALEKSSVSPDDIDMIIVASCTPDKFFPSCAALIQEKLGIKKPIAAFDISVACAGFIYALSVADQFIKSGTMQNILIIGSEAMSRVVDWTDRKTCILFGDGAAGIVLGPQDSPGVHSVHIHAQGQYGDLLGLCNTTLSSAKDESEFVTMNGHSVFKIAVRVGDSMVDDILKANDIDKSEIDWLVPHQANVRIIQSIAKKLSLPMEQVILTVAKHGNTSSASIPLALDEGIRKGQITRGQKIILEGFGGGMAWGSALITY